MTWVYAFLSYHLHKIYTVMYILEFWILSRFQIEHTATLNVRVYARYVNDIPVNQAVQFLALFRLNWCSIQCSGWCSSWQVSLDSLDEYWRRSCFLIESSFEFHNAINMCGCFFTGQSLSLIVTPSLFKPLLSNSKSDTYQSFKSNIKIKKEQIAYKTEQSILFDLISLWYI